MTPNPNIRLQSVVHTLEQVIFPAVDPDNLLAHEQCGMVLAQLRMLLRHLPHLGEYHLLCLEDITATVDHLPPPSGGPLTMKAAAALAAMRRDGGGGANSAATYQALGHALEALLGAAAQDGVADYRSALEKSAFGFARRQSVRERTWFKDAGFDPRPEDLPELEEMFA